MNKLTNRLLWVIYIALLVVLLPHTAWAFRRFEPSGLQGDITAWAAAFAFEAAIAALTERLSKRIESTPRYTAGRVGWRKFKYRYLNVYGAGLLAAIAVSGMANFAHAVEFGQSLDVFGRYSVPPGIYSLAFGGILPVVSLLFAGVLSSVAEGETERDEELEAAKSSEREAKRELARLRQELDAAKARFDAAGDLFARLFADEKRQRIIAVQERWPQLPHSAVAIITESSPSYVSEVVTEEEIQDA